MSSKSGPPIFDSIVRGEWDFLCAILVPRTSEQEYKLFLYLREVAREDPRSRMPRVYLYDLLHTRSPESANIGLERTHELKKQLEEITGQPIGADALRKEPPSPMRLARRCAACFGSNTAVRG